MGSIATTPRLCPLPHYIFQELLLVIDDLNFFQSMYDERTKEWRNIVENVEKRREELGLSIPPKDKSRILAGSVSHIRAMARIVETVAGLDKLLKEQRSAYLAAHGGEYHISRTKVVS